MARSPQFRFRIGLLLAVITLLLSGPQVARLATAAEAQQLSQNILKQLTAPRGLCAIVGEGGEIAIDLAKNSQWLFYVRALDAQQAAEIRAKASQAGFGIDRVVVEAGPLDAMPFATNLLDAVIIPEASEELLDTLSAVEVLRVLRPQGVAIVGEVSGISETDVASEQLNRWAQSAAPANLKIASDDFGTWLQCNKPMLAGADEWSHWEKNATNNPVSEDLHIKAPYMTQFMAGPFYIGMPAVTTISGGRTFLAVGHIAHHRREWDWLNMIIARNGYNGTLLWQRKLPEDYLVHRSAFIATPDTFYMIDGDRCLLLDAQTGKEKGEIRINGLPGEWKWMAMHDGILYVLAGEPDGGVSTIKGDGAFGGWSWADLSKEYYGQRIPVGFGDTLAAFDVKKNEVLWIRKEESLIDSRGLALRDGKLFLYCPDRHMRCLDATDGSVVWTNNQEELLGSIEQPGEGLTSTPGWRTQTMMVATPDALIVQGQTRNNVVAVSTDKGYLLWKKPKVTNNPNAIYVDGNVILGIGKGGSHLVIDPVSGEEKENLNFGKTACTRLTASSDSFFVRGEGTLRFDRESKKVLVDGAQRPACNDGAIPANGLLYLGPWQCDCRLSLIGSIAKCSAGDFNFDIEATEEDRLEREDNDQSVVDFPVSENDWPTYRANEERSSSTPVKVPESVRAAWVYAPDRDYIPTAPVAAGGMIFVAGSDGMVRALDAESGNVVWEFSTPAPIKFPPTIADGRAYFGSGDGYAYCLEAATGRLLWRFRAAPVERHLMVFGNITSTWPVASGVLVKDGVAYFAAGIIDHDGTYVYALDAQTGEILWQNNATGHLSPELRKGVSVQGNLTVLDNQLLLAGGNQVSPARFDLATGQCSAQPFEQGRPKANNGRFAGVFRDSAAIVGGRILYSAAENVATKGYFAAYTKDNGFHVAFGGIPPAWDDDTFAVINYKQGKIICCDADKVAEHLRIKESGDPAPQKQSGANVAARAQQENLLRWQSNLDGARKFEAVSLVVCPNAIVAVARSQTRHRAHPQWYVVGFDSTTGSIMFQQALLGDPLPDGLLVDAEGRIVVTMLDGRIVCLTSKSS